MRTRTEIEAAHTAHQTETGDLILEVLLDIRSLQVTANDLGQHLLRASRKTQTNHPSDL